MLHRLAGPDDAPWALLLGQPSADHHTSTALHLRMPRPLVYPDDEQVVELRADCVTRAFSPSSLVMNQHAGSSTALPAAEATQCWPMASVAAEVWAFIAEGSAFGVEPVEGLVGRD